MPQRVKVPIEFHNDASFTRSINVPLQCRQPLGTHLHFEIISKREKNGLLSFKFHNQSPNLWLVSRLTIAGWCSASSVSDWSDSRFPWGGDVGSMNGSTKLNRINNNNKHMNWHSLQKPFIIPALYYHIIIISARARTRICWMLQVDRLHRRTDPSLRTAPAREIRADRLIRTGPGGPETETCRAL